MPSRLYSVIGALRWLVLLLCVGIGLSPRRIEAHKGLVSPYNYAEHVLPIVRERCGGCHFPGGPAPMSLLSYADAQPWAQAIREQLISEAMPPWYGASSGLLGADAHLLSPRELDILLTWTNGGTPSGPATRPTSNGNVGGEWLLGTPDLIVSMATAHVVAAGIAEEWREFILPLSVTETKWVKSVDFLPGTRSMVREATVRIEGGTALSVWLPGENPQFTDGTAFKLEPGRRLLLQVRYKKNYEDTNIAVKDQSRLGLYFTPRPTSGVESETSVFEDTGSDSTPTGTADRLDRTTHVLALRPIIDRVYSSVEIAAVYPTGKRARLLLLHSPRPDWPRRYWLEQPIELPRGSRITVTTTPPIETAGPSRGSSKGMRRVPVELVSNAVKGEVEPRSESHPKI